MTASCASDTLSVPRVEVHPDAAHGRRTRPATTQVGCRPTRRPRRTEDPRLPGWRYRPPPHQVAACRGREAAPPPPHGGDVRSRRDQVPRGCRGDHGVVGADLQEKFPRSNASQLVLLNAGGSAQPVGLHGLHPQRRQEPRADTPRGGQLRGSGEQVGVRGLGRTSRRPWRSTSRRPRAPCSPLSVVRSSTTSTWPAQGGDAGLVHTVELGLLRESRRRSA